MFSCFYRNCWVLTVSSFWEQLLRKEKGKKKTQIFSFKQDGRVATKTSCRMQDIDTHDFWVLCILYHSETRDCCKKDKGTYRQAESPQPLLPFHELTAVWRLQLETLTAVIWFLPLHYCFPPKNSVEMILNGSEAMQYFYVISWSWWQHGGIVFQMCHLLLA